MEGEPEDMSGMDFGMPVDFQMPDFSGIGKTMKMLSWLPAILTAVVMFFLTFLLQVVYYGLIQADYNLTYGAFMILVLISLCIGLVTGVLVKVTTGRKKSAFGF